MRQRLASTPICLIARTKRVAKDLTRTQVAALKQAAIVLNENTEKQLSGAGMKKRIIWVVLVLLIAGALAGYHLLRNTPIALQEGKETSEQTLSVPEPSKMPAGEIPAARSLPEYMVVKVVEGEDKDAGEGDIKKMFQADRRGNLVLNESTRLNIEKLYALYTPEELESALPKLSTVLPSTAYRQVVNLIGYFGKYIRDIKQIYPPDVETETVEDSINELKGLHDLRVMHFGADVAKAFFADEEKLNRQMLELMLMEKDKNMTMEEKVQKAQQLIKSDPELAKVYDPNRNESIKHNVDSTDN